MQHSESLTQLVLTLRQLMHTWPLHMRLQQSEFAAHIAPRPTHTAHLPLSQGPEQQLLESAQASPKAAHFARHRPPLQLPLQHWLVELQSWLSEAQFKTA